MTELPNTPEEAAEVRGAVYVGGGTDLMPLLKNNVRKAGEPVFLHRVRELRGIAVQDGALCIGAGETLTNLAENRLVAEKFPALARAAALTASPQIRNIATLGGNVLQDRRCIYFNQSRFWRSALEPCFKTGGGVCHQIPNSPVCRALYYSDTATALLVYEAEAECMAGGLRERLSVEELVRRHSRANGLARGGGPPVLVIRFRLPLPPEGERSGFHKYAMRSGIDFPLINFALRCGGSRPAKIAAGAVAPEPVALPETAALLERADVTDGEIAAVCEAELKKLAMPIREACIPPARKRELFRQIAALLPLRAASGQGGLQI